MKPAGRARPGRDPPTPAHSSQRPWPSKPAPPARLWKHYSVNSPPPDGPAPKRSRLGKIISYPAGVRLLLRTRRAKNGCKLFQKTPVLALKFWILDRGTGDEPGQLREGDGKHGERYFCQQEMAAIKILSLIHISEPTRLGMISYAVF